MNFDEIVKDLQKEISEVWSDEDKISFFLTEYNDNSLVMYHHSLGQYIRNKYKLWTFPWEPELIDGVDHSPYHPDNISMTIIQEVWKQGITNLPKIEK